MDSDEGEFTQKRQKGGRKGGKGKKNQNKMSGSDDEAQLEAKREQQKQLMAAMAADSDSDEEPGNNKKKGKGGKKGNQRQQGKRGGKNRRQSEEDQAETAASEVTADAQEESKEETKEVAKDVELTYPLEIVYCAVCGFPPEYCTYAGKAGNLVECKKWLSQNHANMYEKLYPEENKETDEETKADQAAPQKKKPKKVAFAGREKKIRIIRQKRGGRKMVSSMIGFEKFGCELDDVAKVFSKKLGTGAAAMNIEYRETNCLGVQVQGDVSERMEDILESDFAKFGITIDMCTFEDGGNKKNRTMGGGR